MLKALLQCGSCDHHLSTYLSSTAAYRLSTRGIALGWEIHGDGLQCLCPSCVTDNPSRPFDGLAPENAGAELAQRAADFQVA